MGSGVSSQDLKACRMSNMLPSNEEVAARVSAAVAGGFQPEHVNSLPMRPEEGCLDMVISFRYHYSILVVGRVALFLDPSGFSETYVCSDRRRSTPGPRSLW